MLKSKKYIIASICAVLCLTFVGCGKASETKSAETAGDQEMHQSQKANDSEDKGESYADKASDSEEKSDSGSQNYGEIVPDVTMEEFSEMTDEFNNTDDPERKEELRKELEKILDQMESASKTAE